MSNTHFTRRHLLQLTAGYGTTSVWPTDHAQQTTSRDDNTPERWRFETGGFVSASPTIVDGVLYIGSHDRQIYAIDVSTGQAVWTVSTEGEVRSSATVVDGTVYVGSRDENVYALDAETGEKRWVSNIGSSILMSSPTAGDDSVYVGDFSGDVHALDTVTGREIWTYETGGSLQRSSPTVVADTVYIGSADNHLYALDAASGNEQWAFETGGEVRSSPTVVKGNVYVGSFDNSIYAVDAETGEEIWSVDTGGHIGTSSPTVTDHTVYIGGYNTGVYALDASTGEQQWTFTTSTTVDSSPTVVDGIVYVGDSSPRGAPNLYAIDAVRGHLVWQYKTDGPVFSSPTVVDGTVYSGSYDSSVYAFPTDGDGSSEGSRVLLGTLGHHDNLRCGGSATPPTYDHSLLADFTIDTDQPTVNEPVAFDASASTVEDGKIIAYKWDFTGDGTADRTGQSVEHTFSDRGLHPISLTVVDEPGASDTVQRAISVMPRESDLSIAIVDTNSPVEGGDRLTITVEVTNTGEIAHRPEITAIFNGEKNGGVKTTVEPGKTQTHSFGYRTYPVKDEVEISIRAEIETDTATKTATVRAVDELESTYTSPSSELTIRPATQVMFEIDTAVTKPEGTIQWYVDGTHDPTQGAVWPFVYADKVGREFFSYLFESAGTHEVTAAVVRDDGNRATRWTITVTDSGVAPPRIDAARPVTNELAADSQYTLELDVFSSTTNLDRVVWWMTQADTIIGITEISGRSDTASLEINGGCQSCQIEAWVIAENNMYTLIRPWQFQPFDDPPKSLDKRKGVDVVVLETNSPIAESEAVEVRVMLENTESTEVTREIELAIGEKPIIVDSQTVTMAAGATEQIPLSSTIPSELKGEWLSFRVRSDAHQDGGSIHVKRKNTE